MNLLEELWFWCLLHGASPRVSVAVLPRGAEAFGGVFILLFAPCSRPCLVMAAAVGLCDSAPAVRVSSFAAAPSLCWLGRRRATASVKLRPSGRGRHRPLLTATVFAAGDLTGGRHRCHSQPRWIWAALRLPSLSSSLRPLQSHATRTARQRRDHHPDVCEPIGMQNQCGPLSPCLSAAVPLYSYFLCVSCAPGAAACCAMPTRVNEKRRFDCWRPASSPLHLRTTTNTFWTRLMAGGCNAATWSASALVCRARHRDRHLMQPFGNGSGASGHVAFCRDSATRHGGFVGLCGWWGG
ncbi:hypothetical protein Tc00.1047053506335.15 [Trypanosoma cruzi]|uniref:Uncharacterized protein n=1 Tax=Trypanosoma cruzi (strain CL Brener) TaxID=353153 RepID=Q4DGB9_TRYCC|nr:hypothetical protein Tc00.1047053506335.15 [Trypanosoma cruzi]EAN91572.1 hypothetical protein Tc00.1047053506335.15 [Trypanosoma cruzi]|eukprot:XP_813423.1 hypothetical protein [Trypanosoma cruzi strain CL Brener]